MQHLRLHTMLHKKIFVLSVFMFLLMAWTTTISHASSDVVWVWNAKDGVFQDIGDGFTGTEENGLPGVSYDAGLKVLTLNNAQLRAGINSGNGYAIKTEGAITIEVKGNNTITAGNNATNNFGIWFNDQISTSTIRLNDGASLAVTAGDAEYSFGIYSGNLNILGNGTLRINAGKALYQSIGIHIRNALTIGSSNDQPTIIATGGIATFNRSSSYGILARNITVLGGNVSTVSSSADGTSVGIATLAGSFLLNDGTVRANGEAGGTSVGLLASDSSITIYGGTIHAESALQTGVGIFVMGNDEIVISGGTVHAKGSESGIYTSNGNISISAGTVNATGNSSGMNAYSGEIFIGGGENHSFIGNGTPGYGLSANAITISGSSFSSEGSDGAADNSINFPPGFSPALVLVQDDSGNFVVWDNNIPLNSYKKIKLFTDLKFYVALDPNGGLGSVPAPAEISPGQNYTFPANPFTAPVNKVFSHWSVSGNDIDKYYPGDTIKVTKDIIVKANWKDKTKHTISYDLSGGTAIGSLPSEIFDGDTYTFPAASMLTAPAGKTLANWSIVGQSGVYQPGASSPAVTGNITVKANWKDKAKHTISYDLSGGTAIGSLPSEIFDGDTYTFPAASMLTAPAGKRLANWSIEGQSGVYRPGASYVVTGDITVIANWTNIPTPTPPSSGGSGGSGGSNSSAQPDPAANSPTSTPIKRTIRLTTGDSFMQIDDGKINQQITMDIVPFIEQGRVMIPLRYIAKALGYEARWDHHNKIATLVDENNTLAVPLNSLIMTVNNNAVQSDVLPMLKEGRICLSISNIAKALGLNQGTEILWDDATKTVTIIK